MYHIYKYCSEIIIVVKLICTYSNSFINIFKLSKDFFSSKFLTVVWIQQIIIIIIF